DLGQSATEPILHLGTRYELRIAMLQFPILAAPDAELHWFVAETDALTRFRPDVPAQTRDRYLADTRRWVMRDLRSTAGAGNSGRFVLRNLKLQESLDSLFRTFGEASIELWNENTWEAFVLQALWRICRHGVDLAKTKNGPDPLPQRHRDLLLEATGQ